MSKATEAMHGNAMFIIRDASSVQTWDMGDGDLCASLHTDGMTVNLVLSVPAAEIFAAGIANLAAAMRMDEAVPYDLLPEWVEVDEEGFPIDSDDADYIKEVL